MRVCVICTDFALTDCPFADSAIVITGGDTPRNVNDVWGSADGGRSWLELKPESLFLFLRRLHLHLR